jgi:serine/threonine protein kinase
MDVYDLDSLSCASYVDQLNQILHYLGTPSEDTLRRVGSPRVSSLSTQSQRNVHSLAQAQDYIRSLPIKPRVPFSTLFPHANPLAIDLLSQLLCFDPAKRISCEQALNHPYLQVWHDPADEPICESVGPFHRHLVIKGPDVMFFPRNSTSASRKRTR